MSVVMVKEAKKYPLKLENWGEHTYLVVTRGHHDLSEFEAKVRSEYQHFGSFFESAYHAYFKATPAKDGYRAYYTECSPDVRGAFPATVAQEGWLTKFGTESWNRLLFKKDDIIVPLHDNLGVNPPVEICNSSHVFKGETFHSKQTVTKGSWVIREANDYRLANEVEQKLGYRQNHN